MKHLLAAIIIAAPSVAAASEIQEKQCLVAAAQIAQVRSSGTAIPEEPSKVAAYLTRDARDFYDAAKLDSEYHFLDGRSQEDIRNAFARGNYDGGRKLMTEGLSRKFEGAFMVEFPDRVAGQKVVHQFHCVIDGRGTATVLSLGAKLQF